MHIPHTMYSQQKSHSPILASSKHKRVLKFPINFKEVVTIMSIHQLTLIQHDCKVFDDFHVTEYIGNCHNISI